MIRRLEYSSASVPIIAGCRGAAEVGDVARSPPRRGPDEAKKGSVVRNNECVYIVTSTGALGLQMKPSKYWRRPT
jgi:hypothetical protein